jgi:uncharacterized membrane-anchored protein
MYTFQPIPPVDTVNNHAGFVIVSIIMFIVFVAILINNDEEFNMYKVFVLFCIPVGIAAWVSWNTGEYKEYANTRVEGTFVGFQAEGYNVEERSGKTTRRVDKHFTYVIYSVNGNPVLFQANQGVEYPKTAILYRN